MLIVFAGDARIEQPQVQAALRREGHDDEGRGNRAVPRGLHFGGVCPFGIPETVAIYLDESLHRFNPVYPAAGSDNSAVRVSIAELGALLPGPGLGWT